MNNKPRSEAEIRADVEKINHRAETSLEDGMVTLAYLAADVPHLLEEIEQLKARLRNRVGVEARPVLLSQFAERIAAEWDEFHRLGNIAAGDITPEQRKHWDDAARALDATGVSNLSEVNIGNWVRFVATRMIAGGQDEAGELHAMVTGWLG